MHFKHVRSEVSLTKHFCLFKEKYLFAWQMSNWVFLILDRLNWVLLTFMLTIRKISFVMNFLVFTVLKVNVLSIVVDTHVRVLYITSFVEFFNPTYHSEINIYFGLFFTFFYNLSGKLHMFITSCFAYIVNFLC